MRIYVNYRTLLLSAFMLTFITSLCGQGAGFVTIRGKQFYDQGGIAFYPMVLNYEANIAHINDGTSPSDFLIAPSYAFGTTIDYENYTSGGAAGILADFNKIKSMGFNAVRIVGISPDKENGAGFTMKSHHYPNTDSATNITINFNQPYEEPNSNTQSILISKIMQLLDIADSAHIKVILLCVGKFAGNNEANANEYADYLSVLAANLKNHPALLAYDLYNEPHWAAYDSIPQFTRIKLEVCQYVGEWYDAIKLADQNHLITMGAKGAMDVMDVDPGVIKVDFISEHLYPHESQERTLNYNKQEPIDRLKGELYWLNNNLPMPWITGEMGMSADDIDADAAHDFEPWVWGHSGEKGYNDDLTDYVQQSQQLVLNYGGSGYSWWDFENKHWFGIKDGPNNYQHNFYGLLHFGDPVLVTGELVYPDSLDKPVVANAFSNNIPTASNGPNEKPENYYDPYLCGQYNTDHTNAVSGYIYDDKGNPIKDAYISALNWRYYDDKKDKYFHSWIYTFSHTNGSFEVIPYNYDALGDDKIIFIQGSMVGANTFEAGQSWTEPYGWTNTQMQTNIDTVYLRRSDFQNNVYVADTIISTGNTGSFKGGMLLTVSNTIINGSSDFTAREEIHINSEFHAANGSEVHIYPSETFPECGEYNDTLLERLKNNLISIDSMDGIFTKGIELQFKKEELNEWDVKVIPNPSKGLFTIQFNAEMNNREVKIKIKNLTGSNIKETSTTENNIIMDCGNFPRGIYILEITNDNKVISKKIIIN